MKKIVQYPASILRTKTQNEVEMDSNTIGDIKELEDTLAKTKNGAGLAAVQIGVDKRFFGLKNPETKEVKIYINPEIKDTFGANKQYFVIKDNEGKDEDFLEGCLSIPEYFGTVKRYPKILVSYQVLDTKNKLSKPQIATFEGYAAIVFQHELDHLNGILFTDRVLEEGGKFFKQEKDKLVVSEIEKFKG